MIGTAIANVGLGLLNSGQQKKQAKQTLAANQDIASKTLAQQQAQFDKVSAGAQPYQDLGVQATKNLSDPASNFQTSPGYDFRLNTGQQSVLGSSALNGLLRSGAAVKALDKYSQGIASDEYNNWNTQQRANAGIGLNGLNALSGAAQGSAAAAGANGAALTNAQNGYATDYNTANTAGNQSIINGVGGVLEANAGSANPLSLNSFLKANAAAPSFGTSSYGAGGSSSPIMRNPFGSYNI